MEGFCAIAFVLVLQIYYFCQNILFPMKDFVKMVLAVICGILILSIVSFFLTFAMIGAMAAAGSGKPVLPKSGVLSLDLPKVVIAEQSQDGGSLGSVNPASLLAGGEAPADIIGIWDAVQAVNAAACLP
jgi:dolichyl-phosphate-mannose--protein O-mannosyl transferase